MSQTAAEATPDYSWAEYLHCMEGGSDVLTLPQARTTKVIAPGLKESALPGIFMAIAVTVLALVLSSWAPLTRFGLEPVVLAITLGMILSNVWSVPKTFSAGIKFSVKKLLPIGIVFLGARLNFLAVVKVGFAGVLLSVLETVVAMAILLFLAKKLNLPRKLGMLLGVGTAICGGTAIVATAPVIDAEEKDVVFSVATVTLLGLLAMFILPVIGKLIGLSQTAFGAWAGLAIHQTPQVVAAGFAYGSQAGEWATIVKLARVCLLAPVVFVIGLLHARSTARETGAATPKNINYLHLFPMFIFGFLGMALLRTLGFLPDVTVHLNNALWFGTGNYDLTLARIFEDISKYCIIVSMAAVGLETRYASMKQTGAKPVLASLFAAVIIAVLTLALIKVFGI